MPHKTVLIADDSPTIVTMLTYMLSALPCEVLAAHDGIEAIKLSYRAQPDLILLDILMPKMNGYQVCRLLKHDEHTRHIPVVMLTAKDQPADRFWGLATGADEYLVKDFEDSRLLDTMTRYLEQDTPHPAGDAATRMRDITAVDLLTHANNLLDRQLYQSTITNRINKLAGSIQHFDETILSVFELLSRILNYQIGAMYVQATQATADRLYVYSGQPIGGAMIAHLRELALKSHGPSAVPLLDVHILHGEVDDAHDQPLLSVCGNPLVGQNREIGSLFLGDARRDKFSDDDRELLRICSAEIAVVVDNARLYEANARLYADLEQELQKAHDIQLSMLPDENPMEHALRIEAGTIPAKDVGGDYYDYRSLNDQQLLLAIGDVTGKGVAAALMMATVKTALQMRLESTQSVGRIMAALNRLVCEKAARSRQYMTLFLGLLDTRANTLTYCNAGHNFPYRIRPNMTLEHLDQAGGLPLGFQPDLAYQEHTVSIEPDDILFLYTDGVVEAMDDQKELFGYARLEELLLDNCRENLEEIHLRILERIEAFCRETPQDDDMTMLFVQCIC